MHLMLGQNGVLECQKIKMKMISEGAINDRFDKGAEFHFTKDEKKELVGFFGPERAADIIFNAIREREIGVCDDVMSQEDFRVDIPSLKVSTSERTQWQSGSAIFFGTVLGTSTAALSLSTTLSGFERYHAKISIKKPSPKEQWENDVILKQAIFDNLTRLLEKEALSRNRIRVHLLMGNGCVYPTAFPVSIVCWLLRRESELVEGRPISFFDPCAGWGDRLAGALLVGKNVCSSYVGVDPWWKARGACEKVRNKLQSASTCNVQIINESCVSPAFEWPEADVCFTSPPYADLECYGCDEEDQDERQAWRLQGEAFLENFIKVMFQKCRSPVFMLNIAGTKKLPDLVNQTIEVAETSSPYRLSRELTVGMSLSNRPTKQGIVRAEPLLYFVRELI